MQTDTSPKRAFVLGVYSSAVHAKWIGPDGRVRVTALAVANEPYIFWRGDDVESALAAVAIPPEAGRLEPARAELNGPSGIALDRLFLAPLGIPRSDAWLCDLVPHSCMNAAQRAAIEREYVPIARQLGLADANAPPVPRALATPQRVAEIVEELERSGADLVVLLGDQPIRWFLRHFDRSRRTLRDFGTSIADYGRAHRIRLGSRDRHVVPLVHPRQAAELGSASPEWTSIHRRWIQKARSTDL